MRPPSVAAAVVAAALCLAGAAGAQELTEERAREILPRADLTGLTGAQRAQFLEIAGDTFDYAGCNETLARCLQGNIQDRHALRMAALVKNLIADGLSTGAVVDMVERYYAGFKDRRKSFKADDCASFGEAKARVVLVEFSDFQCPHCATAQKPLHDFVAGSKGKVRLCSKYFPLPMHPRARLAASCAEFARAKGKYWPFSDWLFEHQEDLGDAQISASAQALGLDGATMLKEAYGGRFDAVVERQVQEGTAAGVNATPALFFNGRGYTLPVRPQYLALSLQDEEEWQRNGGGWDPK